jgi:hypothetical protein
MGEIWWRFKHYVAWAMGVIGFVLSLLAGFKLIDYYFLDQTFKGLLASWYLFALVGILLMGAAVRTWQTIRKERYANITQFLHQIQHEIRNIETYMDARKPPDGASAVNMSTTSAVLCRCSERFSIGSQMCSYR